MGKKPWDVIHFNWGLHDFKNIGGENQVDANAYKKNLNTLVARLKKTGAKLIWASTTPVPEGAGNGRLDAEAVQYNAIAAAIMKANKIPTNDLYTFVKTHKNQKLQRDRNVHFTPEGSEALAGEVAKAIKTALAGKATEPKNNGDKG